MPPQRASIHIMPAAKFFPLLLPRMSKEALVPMRTAVAPDEESAIFRLLLHRLRECNILFPTFMLLRLCEPLFGASGVPVLIFLRPPPAPIFPTSPRIAFTTAPSILFVSSSFRYPLGWHIRSTIRLLPSGLSDGRTPRLLLGARIRHAPLEEDSPCIIPMEIWTGYRRVCLATDERQMRWAFPTGARRARLRECGVIHIV